jgi:hypothetical protein
MFAKGGSSLAEINTAVKGGLPGDLVAKAEEALASIKSGVFRVDVNEAVPAGSVVNK